MPHNPFDPFEAEHLAEHPIFTLGDILCAPEQHAGWLYLEAEPWTSASQGVFVVFDPDDIDDPVPDWVKELSWLQTLEVATLKAIAANSYPTPAKEQLKEQLTRAFILYVQNDGFPER